MMKSLKFCLGACAILAAGAAGAANYTVEDFSSICGWSTNAVRCVVGDTVTLPAGTYTAVNPRAASVVDNVVTANEPGFTGIVDANGAVGGVIVLPQPAGDGKVYIYIDEIKQNGSQRDLCKKDKWIFADGTPANGWPHAADDVAILALGYSNVRDGDIGYGYDTFTLRPDGDAGNDYHLTLGEMYIGTFAQKRFVVTLTGRYSSGTYEFKRTDGKVPRIVVAGCAQNNLGSYLYFNGYNSANFPIFDFSQGMEIDMGFADGYLSRTVLNFANGKAILPEGKMLSMINTRPTAGTGSGSLDPSITLNSGFVWEGAGIIRNDSDANMRVNDAPGFEGRFEVGGVRGSYGDRATPVGAGVDFLGHTGSNRTVVVDGYITQAAPASDANKFNYLGGGTVKIGSGDTTFGFGTSASYYTDHLRSVGNVVLNGGNFGVWSAVSATDISALTTRVDRLTLGKSTNKLFFWGVAEPNDTSKYKSVPTNFVHIVKAENPNRAQTLLFMADIWSDQGEYPAGSGLHPSSQNTRLKVKIENHADIAIGGVVPWMVGYSWKKAVFIPSIDEDGYLFYNQPAPVKLADAVEGDNIWLKQVTFNLSEDKTVNSVVGVSLRFNMSEQMKRFGAGRTLTVASGAVALPDWAGFGSEGDANNGTLKFGSTGYVYSYGSEGNPGKLHTPMDAAQGLAFGYPGWTLITGDQTGVKEELVVNGCTVILGTENTEATFDVDMRVAGKGVLNVVNVNDSFLKKRTLTLDDCRNFPAKVNLASGVYKARELHIAGVKMKSGRTYGSSASLADVKDDVHFAGEGMLSVSGNGLMLLVR